MFIVVEDAIKIASRRPKFLRSYRKVGVSETTWEDAKEKYVKLAMGGI